MSLTRNNLTAAFVPAGLQICKASSFQEHQQWKGNTKKSERMVWQAVIKCGSALSFIFTALSVTDICRLWLFSLLLVQALNRRDQMKVFSWGREINYHDRWVVEVGGEEKESMSSPIAHSNNPCKVAVKFTFRRCFQPHDSATASRVNAPHQPSVLPGAALSDLEASENSALKRSYWYLCTCMAWCLECSHPSASKSGGEPKNFSPLINLLTYKIFFSLFF